MAAELHLDGDRSFVISLTIVALGWMALRMSGSLAGLLGPNVHRLLVGTVAWLMLFWWFAPPLLKAQPVVFVLAGAGAIAVGAAKFRHWFEAEGHKLGKAFLRDHSQYVVGGMVAGLSALFLSQQYWGSIWTVIGYALLPGLPFAFGWQMAELAKRARFDAKVGDEESFREAGMSEER
ncbi:hypothetical protein [Bradyrhizobium sp. CCGUVB14]|uniref:hypothetical protein n=1 Tax=Bradyrhizobium sp. CCGUVB14 TaxID=2949628 RepID=UPI0020B2B6D4|nr:hypothetical protein [Bradyrhizobium sp. CCGUVB14]MCP3439801.1 hypothetical protein [Bradyrhizobium sp. CCGUVB14]